MGYTLEVCVENMVSALAAWNAGAKRIELCANLMIGGTTPSVALYEQIREQTDLDVRVLLRPRFGDFCYDRYELAELLSQVRDFKRAGAQGIVIGALRPDGSLDTEAMKRLMEAAGGMQVTLHRAFDVCADSEKCLEEAVSLGVGTILTSGRCQSAMEGADTLRRIVSWADGRIDILAGGGVNSEVIRELAHSTGVRSFHMSGKMKVESPMLYRNEHVNMGMPGLDEFTLWQTDGAQVSRALAVLDDLP